MTATAPEKTADEKYVWQTQRLERLEQQRLDIVRQNERDDKRRGYCVGTPSGDAAMREEDFKRRKKLRLLMGERPPTPPKERMTLAQASSLARSALFGTPFDT